MLKGLLIIFRRWLFRLVVLALVVSAAFWFTTWHPADFQVEDVACSSGVPNLEKGQDLTVMSWNVQFFAGTGYVFWHDLPGGDGPDRRPSSSAVAITLEEAADVIDEANPDVLLLQEVDRGASRTASVNQLGALQGELTERYDCVASTAYWKSVFVPYSNVRGSTNTNLAVLSRYRISDAVRHQLPANENVFSSGYNPLTIAAREYGPKHAALEVRMPVVNGESLAVLTTDLDLLNSQTDSIIERVDRIEHLLSGLDSANVPWVLGGDFSLLPSSVQYDDLSREQQTLYSSETELEELIYTGFPSIEDASGADRSSFFTFDPNDPSIDGPDRTVDYFFFSEGVSLLSGSVLSAPAEGVSDHFPVIVTISVP